MVRFMLPLYLNKSARVRHGRMEKCFNLLMFVQMAWLLAWFITATKWFIPLTIGNEASFWIWSEAYNSNSSHNESSHKCLGSHELHFIDHIGKHYENFTCRRMCPAGIVAPDCHVMPDVISIDASHNSITFVTNVEEETLEYHHLTAQGQSKLQNKTKRDFFLVPLETDQMQFTFRYSFRVRPERYKEVDNLWTFSGLEANSVANAETIVLNHKGLQQRAIPPGETGVKLSMPELLELAGRPNWLIQPQISLGPNRLSDAYHSAGPIGWLTGLKIDLEVSCYDQWSRPPGLRLESNAANVCTVQPVPLPPQWVTKTTRKRLGDLYQLVHEHGVEVRLKPGGSFKVLSVSNVVNFLATILVFMQVPAALCRIMATRCLGALSAVYCSMLDQQLNFRQYIAGVAMQIVATNLIFEGLCDVGHCISWNKFCQSLHSAFKEHPELDQNEINVFTMLSFLLLMDESHLDRLLSEKSLEDYAQLTHENVIRRDAFMTAFSMTSTTRMDEFIRLFDKDRKIARLEKIFLPGLLRNCVLTFENHEHEALRELVVRHSQNQVMEALDADFSEVLTADSPTPSAVECEQKVNVASELMHEPQPGDDTNAKLVSDQIVQDLDGQKQQLMNIKTEMESRLDKIEISVGKYRPIEELELCISEQQQILGDFKADVLLRFQKQDDQRKQLETVLEEHRTTIDILSAQVSHQSASFLTHRGTNSEGELTSTDSFLDLCTRMKHLEDQVADRLNSFQLLVQNSREKPAQDSSCARRCM